MGELYIPQEIRKIIGTEAYTRNTTGMSGSDVLIFSKYVSRYSVG